MLTHPKTHRFMGVEAITGLNVDLFETIVFTYLKSHESQYQFQDGLIHQLKELGIERKTTLCALDEETHSQSETVYVTIKKQNIDGFVFIKDSDGYYQTTIEPQNHVVFYDIHHMTTVEAAAKSYVVMDQHNVINNIVEKEVVSPTFSAGGYGFGNALEFCETYESLAQLEGECYISHVIYDMILKGHRFVGTPCQDYKDWGTLDAWKRYCAQYLTLFCDIDGTLITNRSVHFKPGIGNGEPLHENIACLQKRYEEGRYYIVLTTSRPEWARATTEKELKKHNIPYHRLLMGLPHGQRVLINDYAESNPYPSGRAINIPRNGRQLKDFL